ALLFPHLAAHLNRLADVLNGTVTLKLRQRLIMTAGSAASTSGWIAWDNGHSDSAQRLHRIASDASREANYPLLMAFHLGDMSYIPSSRGDARRAEQMLAQALGHVNPIDFPRVFAWLEARRAEELARLGDKAALQLLESSLNHFATTPNSDASWGRFLTSARMDVFALNVYLHLGRHQEAEPLARRVMESVSVTSPLRPVILADVAAAYLKSGDFAQGTEIADQAYRAAAKVHSRWALSRLNNLHQMFHDS
ncbi:MAG: hypothetical protein ACREP9_17965, partial [Candidatus Dormibacteraceae bacterium]